MTTKDTSDSESVKFDLQKAVIGGVIAVIIILIGSWLLTSSIETDVYKLTKTMIPRAMNFCSTLLIALGNILALMLTLLSLSISMEIDFKWSHYQRVKQIALFVTVALITTVITFLIINIPIFESGKTDNEWYYYYYYALLSIISLLGGALITVGLLLYSTIKDIIKILNPRSDHDMQEEQE